MVYYKRARVPTLVAFGGETMSEYYGRFAYDGRLVAAGKFFGGTLGLYGPDGQFHSSPRYDELYYDGEFDEITDEQFEEFKKRMDAKGKKMKQSE